MNPYIFLSSFSKKFLPIIIIGFCIFLFGGGLSYIMALITNQASRDQIYFILTTPTMTIYLSMLTLGGWMMFIDSPQRMSKEKARFGKLEFWLGLVLISLSYMSIEILFRGGL